MILIGENLNVISQTLGPALKERQASPIQEMARAETAAGIDLIDLNIGPARKGGDELMAWVVNTVQGATGKMLSLDYHQPGRHGGRTESPERPGADELRLLADQPHRPGTGDGQ